MNVLFRSFARRATAVLLGMSLAQFSMFSMAEGNAGPGWIVAGGDARRAPGLMQDFGCGACHTIPGISNASGNVGPPLTRFGSRSYIAGMLSNTPPNLIRWLRDPQGVVPGNAMPNTGISEAQARDIAAYLYTLR